MASESSSSRETDTGGWDLISGAILLEIGRPV